MVSVAMLLANITCMKRCDHLPLLEANPGKIRALREVLRAFRRAAPDVAADQWQRFFETGRFNKMVSAKEEAHSARLFRAKAIIGSQRMQMLRYQVVGQLESFIENRANDFRDAVMASSIDDGTRHHLLVVNKLHAWFRREPVVMKKTGEEIPDDVRHLARRIMHGVLARHRRPRFRRLNPWIDQRQATLGPADKATHAPLWVGIRGMAFEIGKNGRPKKSQVTIKVPLKSYAFFEERGGTVAKTVQIIERGADHGRPGEIVIGVITDMEEVFAKSQAAYQPLREELTLDLGLATMFATPDGDLLGRAWREQLERHDRRISGLARALQKQGIRPNQSKRYRARVAAFRGFLKTEIGRVLNRLILMKRPAHVVIERLDFTAPGLSRRLNRILARMGHGVIEAKLNDLAERYGITWEEVNPAYSSQTCSNEHCGYVAKNNRKAQADFVCGACGHKIHADVNAARNLESGRSAFDRAARLTKQESLRLTVHRHLERLKTRGWVASDRAAIVSNPNYRNALDRLKAETPLTAADKIQRPSAPDQAAVRPPQDLVADVSAG
ncbi:zinc ribbon domain-containing protein [Salipiger profundus]|uniref:zinc ribbon domain-containing protein n=1 Tax=Salipiger profundus TaxID=1229727 RepID=UPI0008EF75FE|nr:zinc ribbon domain-containing protein [Salipiger profundus]SFD83432.1 putative transposase [Salipiger profundus]